MGNPEDDSRIGECTENGLARFCLDNASVCCFRHSADARFQYVNRKACETLGYSRDELLGMSVFDIDPTVTPESWPDLWQRMCDMGSITLEAAHRRKDGTVFPVEVTATLLESEGRRFSISLVQDISERKRVSDELRITQFIFDRASFGIFLTKNGGRIVNVNEHACRYLGYTYNELRRMNIFDIDQSHSAAEMEHLFLRLREEGHDHFETVHRRKDGTHVPVAVTSNLLEFNEEIYSVSFAQDITERKTAEKQRLKLETHMREAQKMESLGTLAGGIAHDFNNILAAISGYAELAHYECPADSSLKPYIDQISQASHRAKKLVQQILMFSRQGKSEKVPIDIGRGVEEALKLLRAILPATIEMRQHIPPALGPVFADETQIHQIVMNLCTNAHYAMKDTGGMIEVSLSTADFSIHDAASYPDLVPGKYIKISIADTGSGIDPDQIDRIFDPYFTTKPIGEGTGMGLSTVHGIVRDHGGSIKVYSEVGVGTTFHVFLPVAGAFADVVAAQAERLPRGCETILFVDDEKALIDLGRDLLGRLGYRVETRASAIDAIQAFRTDPQKYDLVISDMTMPKMTGEALARQIKALRSDIPIILSSGFSERINAKAMEAIGVSTVLMKPVTYADLAKTVRRVLGRSPNNENDPLWLNRPRHTIQS